MNQPTVALSIRQPWAWLIVMGHKTIENRTKASHRRSEIYIHASATMTKADYESADYFLHIRKIDIVIPRFEDLPRGGIVGSASLVDCVQESSNQWFTGPYGWVMANAKPLPFQKFKGALNFFLVDLNK